MNKPQNKTAYPTGDTTKTTPDFTHRITSLSHGAYSLEDAVNAPLDTAYAVINALQTQFIGECGKMSDELVFSTLEAAALSIEDAKAIVKHFCEVSDHE